VSDTINQESDDAGADDDDEHPDLVTSIDRERKEAKERGIKRQIRENRKQAIDKLRTERGKWMSARSELIQYAKMMCDYFNFVNADGA
jgi:hypothetical protein